MFTSDSAIYSVYYTARLQQDSSWMARFYLNCYTWYLYDRRHIYPLRLAVFRHEVEDGTALIAAMPQVPIMPTWWNVPTPFGFGAAP